MTACVKCGHDPDALVTARWEFRIDREVKSLNAHRVNVKGWRGGEYKRDRDAWQWWFKAARTTNGIQLATQNARRRVTLTRLYFGRQRAYDLDNLAGGLKQAVDAMVREGLLSGDSAALSEIHYAQERMANAKGGLVVLLEELAP